MCTGINAVRDKTLRGTPVRLFFQMDSGERRQVASTTGVQQGDPMGPALSSMALGPVLQGVRSACEAAGVEAFVYVDDVTLGMMELTAQSVAALSQLKNGFLEIGVHLSTGKTMALQPKGHVPTEDQAVMLAGERVGIAEGGGQQLVGVPVGTAAYEREQTIAAVKEGGADSLARLLTKMPDNQAAALFNTGYLVHRTGYLERTIEPSLSRAIGERADNGALWAYENILELPATAEEGPICAEGCPAGRSTLHLHQQV